MISKYRKKPLEIEAIQWEGDNFDALKAFAGSDIFLCGDNSPCLFTLEGDMFVKQNAYIIKGVKGEFYACDEEIFHMTYEVTDD